MYELGKPKRRGSGLFKLILGILILGGIGAGVVFTTRSGDAPVVEVKVGLPAIGPKTPLEVTIAEPKRGPVEITVSLVQDENETKLLTETRIPRPWFEVWGDPVPEETLKIIIDRTTNAPDLVQGEAKIVARAKAADTWAVSGPETTKEVLLPVRLVPPSIEVMSSNVYPTQGGAEVVVYEVSETAVESGVRAGDWWFPGYPLPKGKTREYFVIFGVPYDLDDVQKVKLVARDDVGNELAIDFVDRFTPKPYRNATITVTDKLISTVVPKIMGKTPSFQDRGTPLDNYVGINSDMRKTNADRLVELSKSSKPEFMWNQPFVQMQAQVLSSFADRRTYLYDGKPVDKQDHLGFDLASTRKAPIPASNRGIVVLAEYFGIYGNAVVIDHGFGLMSLYGHLSSIDVKAGDQVDRAQIIGRTGATGLALGDHLHFTMLLAGLPVTPLEWWDSHWIHDRIALKLGDALGFVEE